MGIDPNNHQLTLQDYVTLPLVELPKYPDFNEHFFWVATRLWTTSMSDIVKNVDGTWVNSLPS